MKKTSKIHRKRRSNERGWPGIIKNEKKVRSFVVSALEKNPKAIFYYKSGKIDRFEFLVGRALKESKGRADPEVIRKILKSMI